jgi:hypothetical protein
VICLALFFKELKHNVRSLSASILFVMTTLLTYSGGTEYAAREGLSEELTQLGFEAMGQEWALRASLGAVGFPLLAATVIVWLFSNRDRRCKFAPLVWAKPIKTTELVLKRLLANAIAVLIPCLFGVLAGVLLVGLMGGLWPDAGLLWQSMLLNLLPGITAWVVLVSAVTTVLPEPKAWVFPLVILWLILTNIPATSMFWFYRSIGNPLSPVSSVQVWLRVVYCCVVAGLSFAILVWAAERERVNPASARVKQRKARQLQVAPSAAAGRVKLALKITLGARLWIALLGVSGLAILLASPIGLLKGKPVSVKEYFILAFSELLFPLLGLLIAPGMLPSPEKNMEDIIRQRPGGEGKLLEQKLIGLSTYLLATCLVYALWLSVFVPSISVARAFGVLFPPMLLMSGLSILMGVLWGNALWAYTICLSLWGSAYYLQERFPWFLSPVYHLAEYSYKLRQDLLWENKLIVLFVGITAIAISFWMILRKPVTVHEGSL